MEATTVIYSKPDCVYCTRAKTLLEFHKKPYLELVYGVNFTRDELLEKFPEAKTFPQIIFEGEYIGGYEQLAKKVG